MVLFICGVHFLSFLSVCVGGGGGERLLVLLLFSCSINTCLFGVFASGVQKKIIIKRQRES